jgi:hypothetical protein
MSGTMRLLALPIFIVAAACGERPTPTATRDDPAMDAAIRGMPRDAGSRLERLAQRMALSLADSGFRTRLKAELDRSPVREHKLHFQRFLTQGARPAAAEVARLNAATAGTIETEALGTIPLEFYMPVPAHRARWTGGEDVLVATALKDHDSPVAFDIHGQRRVLNPDQPPTTPVLALVPVEADFDHPASGAATPPCVQPQGGGGGARAMGGCGVGGGGGGTGASGLWMTSASFTETFEGWLKGAPEFEIHIMGQAGTSDSLTDYQCAGEKAGGPYYFDQNDLTWSGSVLLFSQTQLDSYKRQHPNQAVRVVALEDDDGPCVIKTDAGRFLRMLQTADAAYSRLTGGRDTTTGVARLWNRATALQNIFQAAWSFITTQDDLIGNAIQDTVAGEYRPGANWIVKGENNITHGALKLEMR